MNRRGKSPRIVTATVIGTGGRTRVSGATLRARFGLFDSWAYFTSIGTKKKKTAGVRSQDRRHAAAARERRRAARPQHPPPAASTRSGAGPRSRSRSATATAGTPSLRPDVLRHGRYSAAVAKAGVYRVIFSGDAGPAIRASPQSCPPNSVRPSGRRLRRVRQRLQPYAKHRHLRQHAEGLTRRSTEAHRGRHRRTGRSKLAGVPQDPRARHRPAASRVRRPRARWSRPMTEPDTMSFFQHLRPRAV